MSVLFEDHIKETGERLLSVAPIKKAKTMKECFSCDGVIKTNAYFVCISTLVSSEGNVVNINNYTLCKNCSIKIDSTPIFEAKVSNGK
jgi:hypothetical protein